MRIALAQYAPILGDLAANGRRAQKAVEAAAEIEAVSAIVAVGFHELAEQTTYNSVAVIASRKLLHVQRKLFPVAYPPFSEHQRYARGEELRAVDTDAGRLAVLICND